MDFSKLARSDYDPKKYASPEDALMEEMGKFSEMSRAGGLKVYFNLGGEGGEESEEGGEECPDCKDGSCMEHMDDDTAEKMAGLSME